MHDALGGLHGNHVQQRQIPNGQGSEGPCNVAWATGGHFQVSTCSFFSFANLKGSHWSINKICTAYINLWKFLKHRFHDFYVRLCASITPSLLGMCFKPRHQSLGDHNSASSDRRSLRLPSSTPHLRSTTSPKLTPNFPGFVHQTGQSAWGIVCKYLPEFRALLFWRVKKHRIGLRKERSIFPLSHFWIATKQLQTLARGFKKQKCNVQIVI